MTLLYLLIQMAFGESKNVFRQRSSPFLQSISQASLGLGNFPLGKAWSLSYLDRILSFWGQRLPWQHLISLPPTLPPPLASAVMVAFRCRGNHGASKDQAKGARRSWAGCHEGKIYPLARWAEGAAVFGWRSGGVDISPLPPISRLGTNSSPAFSKQVSSWRLGMVGMLVLTQLKESRPSPHLQEPCGLPRAKAKPRPCPGISPPAVGIQQVEKPGSARIRSLHLQPGKFWLRLQPAGPERSAQPGILSSPKPAL